MATVYCGVDFHARQQTICYLTTEDGEIHHHELRHNLVEVRSFYTGLLQLGQVVVGFESSGYAAWFEELLEELDCDIWVGQASEIRKRAHRRQKNDRRDAELILELMVRGDFPRLHRYSAASREILQQLRHRQRLVKMRTMVINSLRFITVSRGVTLRGKLLHRSTQQRLMELSLPAPLDQQRQELCALLVELNRDCRKQSASAPLAHASRHWTLDRSLSGRHARVNRAIPEQP